MKFSNDWGHIDFEAGINKTEPLMFISVSGIKGGGTMTGKLTPTEARILAGYLIRWSEEHGA